MTLRFHQTAADPIFKLGYRPGLDFLRAVAILAVLGVHFGGGYLPGGFIGVDIFFVLSGFLITVLLLEEWDGTGRIGLRTFLWRRARRLFPALYVFLAVMAISLGGQFLSFATAAVLFVMNWYLLSTPVATPPGVAHLWSLSVEEQFYLVWPALLLALLRRGCTARQLQAGLAAMVAVAGLYRAWIWHAHLGRSYLGTDVHCDGLILGCWMGVALHHGRPLPGRLWLLPAVGILVCVLVTQRADTPLMYYGGFSLVALSAAVLVGRTLDMPSPPAVMVWTGKLSYSIYLWHAYVGWLVDERFGMAHGSVSLHALEKGLVKLLAVVAVASISYYGIERPARRWGAGR